MTRATFPTLLALATCTLVVGCPVTPQDVDLGALQVRPWQPEVLNEGDGDLLADAERVDVTLVIDGKEETLTLDEDLAARDREGGGEGSDVQVVLRTTGATLPDALGRSGATRLSPDGGEVPVTVVLAPPDVEHALTTALPNAREAMTVCASSSGRVWAIGGLLNTVPAGGSFLLDPLARDLVEGPALAPRVGAGCVADDEGGLYLAGGCDEGFAPVAALSYSETGTLGSSFDPVANIPAPSCTTGLVRTAAGTLVVATDMAVFRYTPGDSDMEGLGALGRYGPLLAAFPGEGERILVSGGIDDAGLPVGGSVIYDVADGTLTQVAALPRAFPAITVEGEHVVAIDGRNIVRVSRDGDVETVLEGVVPSGIAPTQIASLHDGRYALLSASGQAILVVSTGNPKTVLIDPARPTGYLLSDAGGALLLVGGQVPGISAVVVE